MKHITTLEPLSIQKMRREYWPNEQRNFTPWLVRNIDLLSEAVGLCLEVDEREAPVGGLSVDILCHDAVSGEVVVVENQIEESDHGHLGQVLTYMAGRGAGTAIWVAPSFRSEHLSAVRWLNNELNPTHSFYAVSFGLYRIGDSEAAVKFDLLESPNREIRPRALSELALAQADFWAGFRDYIDSLPERTIRINKPSPRGYIDIPIGDRTFHIVARINSQAKKVSVELWAQGEMAKPYYDRLYAEAYEKSKAAISTDVTWRRLDERKSSIISLATEADFLNPSEQRDIYAWLVAEICAFRSFFLPIINTISI